MTKKAMQEALRALGVFNNHNLISKFSENKRGVWIEYRTAQARGIFSASWAVCSPFRVVDPDAHWLANGAKRIREGNRFQPEAAIVWASQYSGCGEWSRSPFGGWVPTAVLEAAKAAVRLAHALPDPTTGARGVT